MKVGAAGSFGANLKALREAAGFTQEELAAIAGLSVHAVSALERGERRRPQFETVRALSAALQLTDAARDALLGSARLPSQGPEPRERDDTREPARPALPAALTRLVGRDVDVRTLRQWLSDPAARLISLIGPGGVGKTRLAVELARGIAQESSASVLFVSLAAIRDPVFVASAVAEALELSDVPAVDLPKRARAVLDGRPTLMVLDNFEQVLGAAPLVADLVTLVTSLQLLVTSRAPLRVRGEREYVVSPLELDGGVDGESSIGPMPGAAARLFAERVRDVQPDFRITHANAAAISAICRRLDALPLAIELAAPWMKALTLEELLRRLEHGGLPSTIGPRDLPERQQTMTATVAWSYQLLDGDEQRAFRRFGALPGLFPIDAAASVLAGGNESASLSIDEALRVAAALIDKSLLLRSDESSVPTCPLYYMLETVRAYASSMLSIAGEREDALEGLVRYCLDEARVATQEIAGPAQVEWLDRVREDVESYRAALSWLIERERADEASEIAWGLTFFWVIRGHGFEGVQWYEQILALPSVSTLAESRALIGASNMWYSQGEVVRAREALTRGLALACDIGDLDAVAQAEHLLGHVELAAGNVDEARRRFARCLEPFRALGTPWGIGSGLTGMAWVALARGDVPEVERLLDEATSILRDAGPWFMSLVRYLRAILAVRRHDGDEAISLMRQSLWHIREVHDKFAFVYALMPLAAAAVLKGQDAWAARLLGTRDAITERTGATVVDKSSEVLHQQLERALRERLGSDRWVSEYAAGRLSSIDALLREIDCVMRDR